MHYQALKERHRQERDKQHPNLSLRLHRALSWLNRAEQADDTDGRFIFLWIAFNAAYATDIDEQQRLSEQETFKAFLEKLCSLDSTNSIEKLVWSEFPGSIRVLLDNQYVFQSFWDHQSGKISETVERSFCQWEKSSSFGAGQPQHTSSTRCDVQSDLHPSEPAHSWRSNLEWPGEQGSATRLLQPAGQTGAIDHPDHAGQPRHLMGRCQLPSGWLRMDIGSS